MAPKGCVFCAIVAGDAQAHFVLDDAACVGFLDVRPLFRGHVLIVPRAHKETLADLSESDAAAVFGAARRVAIAVEAKEGLSADGSFIAMNNRISQSVPHAHVHVVPRHKGDGLRGFFWPRQKYASDADAAGVAAKLREALER